MNARPAAAGTDDIPFQGIAVKGGEDSAVMADEEVRRDLQRAIGRADAAHPLAVEQIDPGYAVSDRELASGRQRRCAILDIRMPRIEVHAQRHEALAVVLLGQATQSGDRGDAMRAPRLPEIDQADFPF